MISDEMRELLSAYVDGELPHAEAARVEDSAKRDPRLRRHILAYRRLRDTLRAWDAGENDVEPSGRVRMRALARVKALVAEREAEEQARRGRFFQQPWALAAGVLIAVTAGVLASMLDRAPDAPQFAMRSDAVTVEPIEPYGDYAAVLDSKAIPEFSGGSSMWAKGALSDVIRNETEGVLLEIDGELVRMSRRVRDWHQWIMHIEDEYDVRRKHSDETVTGVRRHPLVASWLKDVQAARTPYDGVLALHLRASEGTVPDARAVPVRTDRASAFVEAGELNDLHDVRVTKGGRPVIIPLGEVWVEPVGDGKSTKFRRARVVTATTWVKRGELVPMAWANGTAADPSAPKQWALRAEGFVLGPKARRKLLNKSGKDAALLDWILATYGAEGLVKTARADMRKHKAVVGRLIRALAQDKKATGFAVYGSKNRVLGTELFATHELMVELAPRLLAGYLLEAGDQIRLTRKAGGVNEIEELARKFLSDELPRQVKSVVDVRTAQSADDWPKGMRQVNLQTPTRKVVGHGLMVGSRPLHLTLFGE